MKLDAHSILTLALLVLCILFGTMWYFSDGTDYKNKLKEADKKISLIEKSRDSLKLVNKDLEKKYFNLDKTIKERDKKIKQVEAELAQSKKELAVALLDLEKKKKEYDDSKKRIKKLRENPIIREDDDLINSLKEKLNKN